jgi:carbonic anhydrase
MPQRLFEAILEANHRAVAGDTLAGLHPADFADELPLVALTCVDVRLNTLLPQALGVPAEQFIWLRNAGNIITGPLSSTMRSLALACAVKGGKEIVVIGHTDCQVGKISTLRLLESFRALGVERHRLPDNLNEYFGIFGSDRQNVIKAAEFARGSPLIGPKIPVHGLLIEIETGRLEWLVNGYQSLGTAPALSAGSTIDALKSLASFSLGEMKFPETKIGELASTVSNEILQRMQAESARKPAPPGLSTPPGFNLGELQISTGRIGEAAANLAGELAQALRTSPGPQEVPPKPRPPALAPPRIPLPPPIKPKAHLRRNPK